MEELFSSWLKLNKPKSQRHYISGFHKINSLLEKNDLPKLDFWKSSNWESNLQNLKKVEEFKNLNSTGNNWLTATLSNFKKTVMQEIKILATPVIPFSEFKWRWAVTTPSESINKKEILFGVLKLLISHDGKKHTTTDFENDLFNLQTKIGSTIDLAKKDRGLSKNIIENSGQYWKALGLLNTSSDATISVTEFGKNLAKEDFDGEFFIKRLYETFKLPNENIEKPEVIEKYKSANLKIYPIQIILNVLNALTSLTRSPSEWYIAPKELEKVIIPLSATPDIKFNEYAKQILLFRDNESAFNAWPSCTPSANDSRMAKEYLLFLANFGILDNLRMFDKEERFYINSSTPKIIGKKDLSFTYEEEIGKSTSTKSFAVENFALDLEDTGLSFDRNLVDRFITSLLTKKFLILSGVSGSGKTKLAQAFASWICEANDQFEIVPVGADWTNKEHLLGYYDSINEKYVSQPTLSLILEAQENENKPYFLILDEMNLSHVERYFSDFLSVIESGGNIHLHDSAEIDENIPRCIDKLPNNLFVVGTVNMDETTYMFSPKVLDRANVIEFRVKETEFDAFIKYPKNINLHLLSGKGKNSAENFKTLSCQNPNNAFKDEELEAFQKELNELFKIFQNNGWDFGFRIGYEVSRYIKFHTIISEDNEWKKGLDAQIVQKLMPKLNGSVSRLSGILKSLSLFCTEEFGDSEVKANVIEEKVQSTAAINPVQLFEDKKDETSFPLTFEKTYRMWRAAQTNGFTSFSEN
jgi:5-methylcytosine-specific restriction protein B